MKTRSNQSKTTHRNKIDTCRSGEIGRRASFKNSFSKGSVGSIPTFGTILKTLINKSNGVTYETYQIEFEKSRSVLSENNTSIPSSYVDHSYDANQDAKLAVWRYLSEAEPEEPNPQGEELKRMMDNIREDEADYEAKIALIMREVDISLADNCVR